MSSLDINGYNATFRAFTDFAEQQIDAGKNKAIARVVGDGPLANRTITAAKHDWVGIGVGRLRSLKDANDVARELFRNAISDMFGGEKNIPQSVKEAMKFEDFGKGKPLTARRILAVRTAIDANGVAKQRAAAEAEQAKFDASISKFQSKDTEAAALARGYSKAELTTLAKAVNLYAKAMGCSEAEALEEVTRQGSKANRLMNYGGRFLKSAENFKNGLRLMDSFAAWFSETGEKLKSMRSGWDTRYEDGMSKTLLNAYAPTFGDEYKGGTEKFVFEELAVNSSIDLSSIDANAVFGFENNPAMSCIGRHFEESRTQTFAQIPPEKRSVLFKALTIFCPPFASNAREANIPADERNVISGGDRGCIVARILKNLDQVIKLDADGKLDEANLVKTCFPEIPKPGPNPINDLIRLFDQWNADMMGDLDNDVPPKYDASVNLMREALNSTGCSIKDAFLIAKGEKQLENVPYYSTGTLSLASLDGTLTEARNQLADDLKRPYGYFKFEAGVKSNMLKSPDASFRFNLPDGESIVTNSSEQGKANIPAVMDKLETLCGPAHTRQASSLLMMTCQSGLAALRGMLAAHGIDSNEHSPVDFNITRNKETGDISIHYTSPKELPFSFEWMATIKPDGYVSTTPFRFTDEATMKKETADTVEVLKAQLTRSSYTKEQIAAANKAIEMIVSTARGDRELLALLRMDNGQVARGVAHNVGKQIRPLDDIARRLELVRDNLNELRTAAKGDQRLFNIGWKHLVLFNGGALKSGTITKICELAAKEDVGKFKGLSKSSPPEKTFAAMCELDRIVNKICRELRIMEKFSDGGGDEAAGVNGFIMGLLFARCDEESLSGFKQAMSSDNGQQLYSAMQQLNDCLTAVGAACRPEGFPGGFRCGGAGEGP